MERCRAEHIRLGKPEWGNGHKETRSGSKQPSGKLPTLSQWGKPLELCHALGVMTQGGK